MLLFLQRKQGLFWKDPLDWSIFFLDFSLFMPLHSSYFVAAYNFVNGKKVHSIFNLSQGPLFTNRYLFHFVKCFLQNWSNTHFAFNVPSYHLENTKWAELVNLLLMYGICSTNSSWQNSLPLGYWIKQYLIKKLKLSSLWVWNELGRNMQHY